MISRSVSALAAVLIWLGPVQASAQAVDPGELGRAIRAQESNTPNLLGLDGVVGTAVGLGPRGRPAITVYAERSNVQGLPAALNGFDVRVQVTGPITPLRNGRPFHHVNCDEPPWKNRGHCADDGSGDGDEEEDTSSLGATDRWPRPVPIGVSTGHPDITAGTICCRVTDGNNTFVLSNNHVYADSNDAAHDDAVLQPGPYDGGGEPSDEIGRLREFVRILFDNTENVVDAAIADSGAVGKATPPNGYGEPKTSTIDAELGMQVQKYGRTTEHTTGHVDGINVMINVNYGNGRIARFVDQIAIKPGGFSRGGDSGSLVVVNGGPDDRRPVGLLFAGGSGTTFANPIDAVLDPGEWTVTIDGE